MPSSAVQYERMRHERQANIIVSNTAAAMKHERHPTSIVALHTGIPNEEPATAETVLPPKVIDSKRVLRTETAVLTQDPITPSQSTRNSDVADRSAK